MRDERDEIPASALRALEYIEGLRIIDMYDRETVLMLAASFGHEDGAVWLAMNRHLYFIALEQSRSGVLARA